MKTVFFDLQVKAITFLRQYITFPHKETCNKKIKIIEILITLKLI